MAHVPDDANAGQPFCLTCRYPLVPGGSPTCPECGRPFDLADRSSYGAQGQAAERVARLLPLLKRWHRVLLISIGVLVALGTTGADRLAQLAWLSALLAATATLTVQTRLGWTAFGWAYAARHLLLALVLVPFLLMGVMFIPMLVHADATRWLRAERQAGGP